MVRVLGLLDETDQAVHHLLEVVHRRQAMQVVLVEVLQAVVPLVAVVMTMVAETTLVVDLRTRRTRRKRRLMVKV